MTGPAGRRWRRLSLRWRLMLLGTAGLSLALLLGSRLVVAGLAVSLRNSADGSAAQTAGDVAQLIEANRLPTLVPVAGAQLVQVLDARNTVLAASPGVDRLVPLLQPGELARALGGEHLMVAGARAGQNEPLRVSAVPARQGTARVSVLVAVPAGDLQEGPALLGRAFTVALPVFVLVIGAVAWWVIGLTLRPVEALRSGAERLTGAERLPVPEGADEIHRLAVTLNGMLDRLEAAGRRQREFVADAAHELRNPLAAIRTQLEVANRHPARTDWQALTADVLTDVERLGRLSDDLLLLARADENPMVRPPAAGCPVAELLRRVAARYPQARVPVAADPVPGTVLVAADPEDVHRVLTNLVDNAVRYAATGVRLSAAAEGREVVVTVTDDGPGVPVAERERVFDRFSRLDDARAHGEGGAGLGLPIVAELVRLGGGTVALSDAGPGLRVEVRWPSAEGVAQSSGAP